MKQWTAEIQQLMEDDHHVTWTRQRGYVVKNSKGKWVPVNDLLFKSQERKEDGKSPEPSQ